MRIFATGLLVLMAVGFLAASLARERFVGLRWLFDPLRAFAEAGMVGGLADWFAVSALFRRPLGLPIPHTAIVPRNKDRIGEALGRFLAENFLTEAVLETRIEDLNLAGWSGQWLCDGTNARRLAARLSLLLPDLLSALPPGLLAELAGAAGRSLVRNLPAATLGAATLDSLWRDGRAQPLLDRGLSRLADYLATQEAAISSQVAAQTPSWVPGWADRALARRIAEGLSDLFQQMRAPEHPWRQDLARWMIRFAERLRTEPQLQARAEALKLELLEGLGGPGQPGPFAELEVRLRQAMPRGSIRLARALERALLDAGIWLADDAAAQARVNGATRYLARMVIAPRRHEIGRQVAQVVAGWDATAIADKLELQVGRDLQYIRINGALVGGLAGVAIWALSRLLNLG